jgi:hypothetical protein
VWGEIGVLEVVWRVGFVEKRCDKVHRRHVESGRPGSHCGDSVEAE